MILQEVYDLAVEMGIKADPRGVGKVKRYLEKTKKRYKDLSKKKKKYFDKEAFTNPYTDTRIFFGDKGTKVDKIMAGIDAEASEILLADRLNQKGEGIDAVISHHPHGHSLAALYEVMDLQIDMYEEAGVPVNIAHALFQDRISQVQRKLSAVNHNQSVDTARLLGIPLMSLHTVWDNLGNDFMKKYLAKANKDIDTVGEILDYINEIPEFVEAAKGKAAPIIVSGSPNSRSGRVVVGFTGGTSSSKELYMELGKAGVGTIVEMHIPEESVQELKKAHINVIDCGHMAADSIGANLYLDELEKRGIKVIACSGLIRVKRKK